MNIFERSNLGHSYIIYGEKLERKGNKLKKKEKKRLFSFFPAGFEPMASWTQGEHSTIELQTLHITFFFVFQRSLEDQLGRVGGQPAGADVRGHEGVTHQEAGQLISIEDLCIVYTTSIE